MMRNANTLHYVTYDSETVVFDESGKRIVSYPTEEEAVEFIREADKKPQRFLKVDGILVEVSEEVYAEYYRMDRQERYQIERDIDKGTLYYEAFSLEDMSGEEMIADMNQKSVEEQVELECMTPVLLAALKLLTEEEMKLIYCIYYENKSVRFLSREWNIPETTVRRRHEETIWKLRQMLE